MPKRPIQKHIVSVVFLLSIVPLALFLLWLLPGSGNAPSAENGVLDLTAYSLEEGPVNLTGQWVFYWRRLLTHEDFDWGVSGGVPASVPAVWSSYRLEGQLLPAFGNATYRLRIIADEPGLPMAVCLESVYTTYRLFADGSEITSNGMVGDTPTSTQPGYLTATAFFTPRSREFDLIIQVSNFSYARGGLWYGIRLGAAEKMAVKERLALLDMLNQWVPVDFPVSELSSLGFTVFISLFSGLLAFRFSSIYKQNRTLVAQLEEALEKERELGRTLARYDRLKDDFLLKTSHELMAPLHSIINLLEAAEEQPEVDLPSSLRDNLSYALITARRMSSLIRDISDFEALRLGSLKLSCDTVDLSAPLRVLAEIMSPLLQEKGLALHLHVLEGECIVLADESRLRQIFFTLLGNAMKYTQRGSVTVLVRPEGDQVTVCVRDTGVGLQDDRKCTLFHYFESFKTEDAYSATPDTSGIGLAIARSLALQMGGGLELGWSEPGRGTELVLTLPAAPGVRREAWAGGAAAPHWEGPVPVLPALDVPTGAKILVVDDEVTNIRSVKSLLGGLCSVLAAYSGVEALELLNREGEVELVILDMMLPGLSGFEVCRRIRERHTPFQLPILLAAARPGPEEIEAGLAAGANDFVSKPFEARELRARASSLLELRRSAKEAVGLELAFLRSQIHPHFLFNSLSVIVSLCYTDGRRAGDLLGEFSACLRYSFDFDPENAFAPLGRELEVISSYLAIEQARFGERLRVQYDVPEALLRRSIPVLCLQTLVENAVRHGLMKRLEGGTVFIGAEETAKGGLLLTVRDNGAGLPPDFSGEGGVGLRNIRRRLAALESAGLELRSISGGGTEALLRLPALPVQTEKSVECPYDEGYGGGG